MLKIKVTRQLRDFPLDVELTAEAGETLVLMGSNGSGKTTVLNLVAGLAMPDSGEIEVGGQVLFSSAAGVNLPPERRRVGYVFQHYALFPHLSIFDNVAFGLRRQGVGKTEVERQVRKELELLELWELRQVKPGKLSGGQRQKVALARGLVTRPSILLLDEPLSALDAGMHATLREALRARLKQEKVQAILVLHNLRDAAELGDRVCLLEKGRVSLTGKPADVLVRGHSTFIDNLLS